MRERWGVELALWKPPVFALDPLEPGADGSLEIGAFDSPDEEATPAEAGEGAAAEDPEARDARREARETVALAGPERRGAPCPARRRCASASRRSAT